MKTEEDHDFFSQQEPDRSQEHIKIDGDEVKIVPIVEDYRHKSAQIVNENESGHQSTQQNYKRTEFGELKIDVRDSIMNHSSIDKRPSTPGQSTMQQFNSLVAPNEGETIPVRRSAENQNQTFEMGGGTINSFNVSSNKEPFMNPPSSDLFYQGQKMTSVDPDDHDDDYNTTVIENKKGKQQK